MNSFKNLRRLIVDTLPTANPLHRGVIALRRTSGSDDELHVGLRDSSNVSQFRRILTKPYGDSLYAPIGSVHDAVTVADTSSIDFSLTGQQVSGSVIYAGSGSAATAARSDHNHDSAYEPIGGGAKLPLIRTHAVHAGGASGASFAGAGTCRAYYLGPADKAYTSIVVMFSINSGASGVTWAELGVGTSDELTAIDDDVNMTTRGYTSIASAITSSGDKTVTISTSGITVGAPLWLLLGYVASGNFNATVVSEAFSTGAMQTASATSRPSTWTPPHAFTHASGVTVPLRFYWFGSV